MAAADATCDDATCDVTDHFPVFERVTARLAACGVPFTVSAHAPSATAEAAAEARGTPLEHGGKTLLLKVGKGTAGHFGLFTVRACDALNRSRLRKHFGTDRIRFASREELLALTGLTPGSVPPFGAPVFDLPLYVDSAYAARADDPAAMVVFTAGRNDRSVTLSVAGHLSAAAPTAIYAFAEAQLAAAEPGEEASAQAPALDP